MENLTKSEKRNILIMTIVATLLLLFFVAVIIINYSDYSPELNPGVSLTCLLKN